MSSLTAKGITGVSICGDDNDDRDKKQGVTQGQYQLVYFTPKALVLSRSWRYIDDGMLYLENTDQCCRKILFSDMEGYHTVPTEKLCLCCDICKKKNVNVLLVHLFNFFFLYMFIKILIYY